MGKHSAKKKQVSHHLSTEEKKIGKNHLYLLLGMIIVGGAIGIYFINQGY